MFINFLHLHVAKQVLLIKEHLSIAASNYLNYPQILDANPRSSNGKILSYSSLIILPSIIFLHLIIFSFINFRLKSLIIIKVCHEPNRIP